MFDCKICNGYRTKRERDRIKKRNGCVSPTKKPLWQTDECFLCGGSDRKCSICKGSNSVPVFRCPRALAKDTVSLLPFFTDWRVSNRVVWPNGGSRLAQPVTLATAFDLLNGLLNKYEKESLQNG